MTSLAPPPPRLRPRSIPAIRTSPSRGERFAAVPVLGALLLLTAALFSTTLMFPPANGDDLGMLSAVANRQNPLMYFVSDWGLGNNEYRPLHSISIWIVYHLFGVSATPNQLINICLHFLVVCLLFGVLYCAHRDRVLAGLLAALVLVSEYTMSSASWVSDRPSLLVALFALLLIYHLLATEEVARIPSALYIGLLSVLALMSKESGLVVPLLALAALFIRKLPNRSRLVIATTCFGVLVLYAVLRLLVFGPGAALYSEKGYLFGVVYYDDWARLAYPLKELAVADIVLKNIIAPIIPVFSNLGQLLTPSELFKALPIWLPTVLLVAMATTRRPSRPQLYAMLILVFNAAIYFVEFRYRGLYLAQIAVCLYLGASPRFRFRPGVSSDAPPPVIQIAAKALAGIVLVASILAVNQAVVTTLIQGHDEINRYSLTRVIKQFQTENQAAARVTIDPRIVQQVLDRYRSDDSP